MTYGKAGDPTKAAAAIEKAIVLAKQEKASTDKIEMLKTRLEKYKTDSSGGT